MTPEQLAAIRERANNATPGPWTRNDLYGDLCGPNGEELFYGADGDGTVWARELEDAIFATHAREDIPALLDRLEAVQATAIKNGIERDREIGHSQRLGLRIAAVRKLHKRGEFEDSPGDYYCTHCQVTAGIWPCPTIQALDGDQ